MNASHVSHALTRFLAVPVNRIRLGADGVAALEEALRVVTVLADLDAVAAEIDHIRDGTYAMRHRTADPRLGRLAGGWDRQ